jgi:hypothetical protein
MSGSLPTPPFYFPLRHGRYDVAPGLNRFGKEFGGADADQRVFQLDQTFDTFRHAKLASRRDGLSKYVCASELDERVAIEATRFIINRLALEHSEFFKWNGNELRCTLTNQTLVFDSNSNLIDAEPQSDPPYTTALDALACQVQEDLAIVSTDGPRHWISYLHVCLPNGWAPSEKIGGSFGSIHAPVAGMSDMNRRGEEFVRIMIGATDGLVRFAWGVTFDDELNHHPDKPRTRFDPANPRAFLRVERQTIWGFPAVGAALFAIRTYLYDCDRLRRDAATREPLVAALASMPVDSRIYKGLSHHDDDLLTWLTF